MRGYAGGLNFILITPEKYRSADVGLMGYVA